LRNRRTERTSHLAGLWIGAVISNTSHSNKAGSTTVKRARLTGKGSRSTAVLPYKHKKFPYRPTRDVSLLSAHASYIGLHAKCPLFLSGFNGTWISRQIFEKHSNIKFHENPPSGLQKNRPRWDMEKLYAICSLGEELFHADGHTDMTKLTVAYRNFANVLNYRILSLMWVIWALDFVWL